MPTPFDFPLAAGLEAARWAHAGLRVWEAWRMTPAQLVACRRRRLVSLLAHARSASPFYRQLHAGLPLDGASFTDFPIVEKRALMSEFDRVSTRPDVNRRAVERFVSDPGRHGTQFAGGCAVWTSSGTTGQPGWFVHDADALAIYDALEAQRFRGVGLARSWRLGERYAMVAATGGHFAGVSSVERLRRSQPWLAPFMRSCSLMQPLPRLVAELNAYAPAILATYPTAGYPAFAVRSTTSDHIGPCAATTTRPPSARWPARADHAAPTCSRSDHSGADVDRPPATPAYHERGRGSHPDPPCDPDRFFRAAARRSVDAGPADALRRRRRKCRGAGCASRLSGGAVD